jgi:hypothetical protein
MVLLAALFSLINHPELAWQQRSLELWLARFHVDQLLWILVSGS